MVGYYNSQTDISLEMSEELQKAKQTSRMLSVQNKQHAYHNEF